MSKSITGKSKVGLKIGLVAIFLIVILFSLNLSLRNYNKPVSSDQSIFALKLGRSMGILAVILLIIGPIFSLKNKLMDQVFSLDKMFYFHKVIALICLIMASLHPMTMYLSKLKVPGPTDLQQWPELLGAIGLFSLWLIVCSSIFRKFLMLEFEDWRKVHLLSAGLRYAAVIHVFAIESKARSGAYAYFLVTILALTIGLAIWDKLISPWLSKKERSFKLFSTKEVAPEIFEITLKPETTEATLDFSPGQFAYVKIKSNEFAFESHPFTIATSPTNKEEVSFYIKSIGDWSKKLANLPAAMEAEVIGPFGQFSPFLFNNDTERLVLIAGGIGITPFISLIRSLAAKEIDIPILLLWTNKTAKDFFNIPEFDNLKEKLPAFTYKLFVSREKTCENFIGKRIDKAVLQEVVPPHKPGSQIMICGPQIMMKSVHHDLVELGFPQKNIHFEDFSYLD